MPVKPDMILSQATSTSPGKTIQVREATGCVTDQIQKRKATYQLYGNSSKLVYFRQPCWCGLLSPHLPNNNHQLHGRPNSLNGFRLISRESISRIRAVKLVFATRLQPHDSIGMSGREPKPGQKKKNAPGPPYPESPCTIVQTMSKIGVSNANVALRQPSTEPPPLRASVMQTSKQMRPCVFRYAL